MNVRLGFATLTVGVGVAVLLTLDCMTPDLDLSCTAFMFRHASGVVDGKNLDWPVGEGAVLINPSGVSKTAWVIASDEPVSWVSRFSSVTFNQFGREFPLGGMNEAGLVVEELSYWPATYPPRDHRPAVNELQWIQYQLDNFATVQDVLARESAIRISPFLFGLHYFVTDAGGDAAIIEYLDGVSVVYAGDDLPVVALTNDTYGNLLRQLRRHAGFGGERVAGSGPESPERFVRTATRIKQFESSPLLVPVDSAFALLEDVAQEDTQWSIVYDPNALTVHFRTSENHSVRSVRLADLPSSCGQGVTGFRIRNPSVDRDAWTVGDNESLLAQVFDALAETGVEVPSPGRRLAMARYPGSLICDPSWRR